MKLKNTVQHLAIIALAFSGLSLNSSQAANLSWDADAVFNNGTLGGTGTWNTALLNWDNASADQAWATNTITGDTALFAGTAGTATLGTSINALGLQFTTTGYTVATGANTLALGTGGIDASGLSSGTTTLTGLISLGAGQSWNVGSGATLTSSAAISGGGSLTKTGAGTLTLSATNTFSGGLTISTGTVVASNVNQLGGTGGTVGGISLNGGELKLNLGTTAYTNAHAISVGASGGTLTLTSTSGTPTLTLGNAGNLTGSGNLTINGNGTLVQAGSAGASVLNMNNANVGYSGNVTVTNGGVVEFGNATAIPTTSTFTVNNLGMLSTNGPTIAQAVNVNAGGVLAFQNAATGVFSGPITLTGSTTVRLQNWWNGTVQNGTISGAIGGTGGMTINCGSGTGAVLTLNNAASDYAGATSISGAVVNINTGGTLANVNTASSIGKGSAGGSSADLVLNNGTLRYTGAAAQSTDRLFSVGTANGTLDASGSNVANPLSFTGTGAMGFNSQTGTRTLTLTGTNTGSNSLALAIGDNTGATSVTKTGAGTWALGGANTYSGATTVTTGALSFLNLAAKSASTTVTAAAGTTIGLGVGGAGFFGSADVNSLLAGTLSGFTLDAASLVGIDTTAGDFTLDSTSLSGTRILAKLGVNTLILSGTNTYAGATQIQNGTLEFQTAAAVSSSSALTIGNGGTLSFRADADTTFTPASVTGSAGTSTIAVNQITGAGAGKTLTLANSYTAGASGSSLTVSSASGDTLLLSSQLNMFIASAPNTTINLNGANLTLNAGVNFNGATNGPLLIVNANSNTLLINGNYTTGGNRWAGIAVNNGTVTMANGQTGGSSTNNGVYAVLTGGTLNLNNANAIGGAGAGNTFTITGGTVDNTSGAAKTLTRNPVLTFNGNFAFSTSGGTSANDLSLGTNTVSLGAAAGTTRTITTNGSATLTVGGIISNGTTANGLTKAGTGVLSLTGANTYTGDTIVNAGVLAVNGNAIANTNKLVINGGKVSPTGTEVVDTLYFGATQQAPGTWGATGSGATHIDNTHFTGAGVVSVANGPVGYASWGDVYAPGQTIDQDHDNDGVANGIEYFMGQTGSTFTANPAIVSGTVTWPMAATYAGVYGTDYEIQTSGDLVTWTQVPQGAGAGFATVTAGVSVAYTLPTGGGKVFARLVVKN
ncbi:MAG: autotransporter-associated beta strand repeat-containing protein [Luteolibacter sp.]